jgi:hypothetical protein
MLSLHRSWCEFTTRKFSTDPLSSRYGVSVIACYRSATALLAVACEAFKVIPHPMIRLPCIFYQAFTAAVSVQWSIPLDLVLMRPPGNPCLHRDTLPFASFRKRCFAAREPCKGLIYVLFRLIVLSARPHKWYRTAVDAAGAARVPSRHADRTAGQRAGKLRQASYWRQHRSLGPGKCAN